MKVIKFEKFHSKFRSRLPEENAEFYGCSFKGANLVCSQFRNCKFFTCDFSDGRLLGTEFWNCKFENCLFCRTLISERSLLPEQLAGAEGLIFLPKRGKPQLDGVKLDKAYLAAYSLRGGSGHFANFSGVTFYSFSMTNTKLFNADLSETVWKDFKLSGCDFSGSNLSHSCFNGGRLKKCILGGVDFAGTLVSQECEVDDSARTDILVGGGAFVGPGKDLRGLDLRRSVLQDLDLGGADLSGCDLRHAYIGNTSLRGAKLFGCKLQGTRITRRCLDGALYDATTMSVAKVLEDEPYWRN